MSKNRRIFKEILINDFDAFDKIEKLINEGDDINKDFEYYNGCTECCIKGTPLYHSICK